MQETGWQNAGLVTISPGQLVAAPNLIRDTVCTQLVVRGAQSDWTVIDIEAAILALKALPDRLNISLQIDLTGSSSSTDWFAPVGRLHLACKTHSSIDLMIGAGLTTYPRTVEERTDYDQLVTATEHYVSTGAITRWLSPLIPTQLYQLESLFSAARMLDAEPVIIGESAEILSDNDRLFALDFIRYRIFGTDAHLLTQASWRGNEALEAWLETGAQNDALLLNAQNNLLAVSDQTPASIKRGPSFLTEAASVMLAGLRAHFLWGMATLRGRPKSDTQITDRPFNKALLIGAYGGEHIGDMGILGGVLLRLHERHGVTEAVLMTQRPDHTRHLVKMIDTPVTITVREYRHSEIKTAMDDADAIVFAGGPLIDLPKQLVLHLYAAALAHWRGKPFLMEGIGPGPFQRLPSQYTARRLLGLADYISLRTRDNASVKVVEDKVCDIGRDPAFDYLDTRQGDLDIIAEGETDAIENLLAGSEGRPVIGLNIRPIYHQYAAGVADSEKENYSHMVEDRFERRLAEAINTFSAKCETKPVFVFFPMNAVQFGLSDMTSAWRITRHINADVDWRVWQADATLDAILILLRRMDAAITMRFHATIFALSQGTEAIGIDYRIGKRDKVAAVLSDVDKEDQCARIDEMTTEWLIDQLTRFIPVSS